MAFKKKTWKDRMVEYAGRRKLTNISTNQSIICDVARSEGTVSQEGDALSSQNLNDLEQRIEDGFTEVKQTTDTLNQNLQELKEGIMKIATKTVTVTTGNGGSTYQNEIDLNDMGLDISKIIACYFEPSNAGISLTSTDGGQCTLAKNYNTATGILTISIGSTTYCRPMTWTGTVIAITA